MSNLIGQSIGRYHILDQLGEGGMATVYKAYDTRLERYVAIKVIRNDLFGPTLLERMLKRFEREARALAKLSHPNIVKILDYGEHKSIPYLVMEYLPGGTLKEKSLGKRFPWKNAIQLLAPIAQALEHAHACGILHRDIKPSNILITQTGEPMLSDFGIAKILEDETATELTATGAGIGTPEYMAPEQWTGKTVPQSDVYSLGIVLYEIITGHKPYMADTPAAILIKKVTEALPRPSRYIHDLPEKVELLLIKALARDPENRFASMQIFSAALASLLHDKQVTPAYSNERILSVQTNQPNSVTGRGVRLNPSLHTATQTAAHNSQPKLPRYWKIILSALFITSILSIAIIGILILSSQSRVSPLPADTQTYTLTPPDPTKTVESSTETPTIPPTISNISQSTPTMTPAEEIIDIAGVTMRLIPAGTFTMGTSADIALRECHTLYIDGTCGQDWFRNEEPVHTIDLDSFYMDKYEVSNFEYRKCVESGQCSTPDQNNSYTRSSYYNDLQFDNYPVIYVDWNMAQTYCKWRGARLPTEAEWEKAARGLDGRIYPWGNVFDGTLSNFCDSGCQTGRSNPNFEDGYNDTAPVNSYSTGASVYGVFNMSGNVWEWVADRYSDTYYENSPVKNPIGPDSGEQRIVRGGSWYDYGYNLRVSLRWGKKPTSGNHIGFRCATNGIYP